MLIESASFIMPMKTFSVKVWFKCFCKRYSSYGRQAIYRSCMHTFDGQAT